MTGKLMDLFCWRAMNYFNPKPGGQIVEYETQSTTSNKTP